MSTGPPPGSMDAPPPLPVAPLSMLLESDAAATPQPKLPGSGTGIATGRRAARAQVTALVLSLRRRAEADAQEQLRQVRGQLELARRAQAQVQQQLDLAEQERQRLSKKPVDPGDRLAASGPGRRVQAIAAELLANQSERLLRQRQLVRELQRGLDAQAVQVQTLLQNQGELHAVLRLALARREAAELHEAEQHREQRRAKAQHQRTLEEEVRDRFLSAQRQAKPPRR